MCEAREVGELQERMCAHDPPGASGVFFVAEAVRGQGKYPFSVPGVVRWGRGESAVVLS